ncbi:hypothetical protein [Laspinema olomoucense]|uniref:Uncharacterized protein n=1 Tax=Laspinema olomoucense D3b TaxID=2953688 RepID=A0ABT2NF53_9CYAN|nr:hypothetical protein [Laspinema sp. D3b]MCT7981339.1 hypothetical protein [Laspinema sp. D3b]
MTRFFGAEPLIPKGKWPLFEAIGQPLPNRAAKNGSSIRGEWPTATKTDRLIKSPGQLVPALTNVGLLALSFGVIAYGIAALTAQRLSNCSPDEKNESSGE